MIYSRAITSTEITNLYTNVIPVPKPSPTIDISCKSSTSFNGFKVEINGNLEYNSTPIPNAPILLSTVLLGEKLGKNLHLAILVLMEYTQQNGDPKSLAIT